MASATRSRQSCVVFKAISEKEIDKMQKTSDSPIEHLNKGGKQYLFKPLTHKEGENIVLPRIKKAQR